MKAKRKSGSSSKRVPEPRINVKNLQPITSIDVLALNSFSREALTCCLRLHKRQSILRTLPEILVWLISDRRMADLHQRFLHQPGPTDVLTFEHGEIFI